MECQNCKQKFEATTKYCPNCGKKLVSEAQIKLPRTNLFLLTVFSFFSGGIYFPVWYMKRRLFLGYDQTHKLLFNKWIFVGATVALVIATILGAWYAANLGIAEDTFRQQGLEKIKRGEDILSVYKDNPELFVKRIQSEMNLSMIDIGIGLIGIYLFIASFASRSTLNVYLREYEQKPIPVWLWFGLAGSSYILLPLTGLDGIRLLWTNFPLIFLMQYKMNRLSIR